MLISDSSLLAYHLSGFFFPSLLNQELEDMNCDQIKMPPAYEHYAVSCNQMLRAEKKHYHL